MKEFMSSLVVAGGVGASLFIHNRAKAGGRTGDPHVWVAVALPTVLSAGVVTMAYVL